MNIYDILNRSRSLKEEYRLDSVTPERLGALHEDTLKYINEYQLLASSPSLHKIYASVSAMQSDKSPKSDLTGKALKPGQLVVIVPANQSDAKAGDVYRYDGPSGNTSAWTFVSKIGGVPADAELSATSTNPPQNQAVTAKLTELESKLESKMELVEFKPSTLMTADGTITTWGDATGITVIDVSRVTGDEITFNISAGLSSAYNVIGFYSADSFDKCNSSTFKSGVNKAYENPTTIIVPDGTKLMLVYGSTINNYQSRYDKIYHNDTSVFEDVDFISTEVRNHDLQIGKIDAILEGESIELLGFTKGGLLLSNGDISSWSNPDGFVSADVSKYNNNRITFQYNNSLTSAYALVMCYTAETIDKCNSSTKIGTGILSAIHKGDSIIVPEGAKLMLVWGFVEDSYQDRFRTYVEAPSINGLIRTVKEISDKTITLNIPTINTWGDSLTDAGEYQKVIKQQFPNFVVNNFGVFGEGTFKIIARQGGAQCYLGEDVSIPSGTTSISIPSFYILKDDGTEKSITLATKRDVYPIKINDVSISSDGTILNPQSKDIALHKGTSVVINSSTKAKLSAATIFWMGTNGLNGGCPYSHADVELIISQIKKCIAWEGSRIYCVLGIYSNDPSFVPNRDYMDERMRVEFGSNFVDVRYYLVNYGLTDAGITPTSQDITDIANKEVPHSLLGSDAFHLNNIGYSLVGNIICESLKRQGL